MADKKLVPDCIGKSAILLAVFLTMSACVPVYRMTGKPLKAHCIGTGVTAVSTSTDSDKFVISYCDDKKSLIAVGNFSSGQTRVVLTSDTSLFLKPIFLNQDNDIAFIERSTIDQSMIKMIHKDGSVMQMTSDSPESHNIRDITLSLDGQTIYYVNSQKYNHSSPLGPYLPHDNDFYSLSIHHKSIKRRSFSNRYHLSGVSISRDEKTIFSRGDVLESGETKLTPIEFGVEENLAFTAKHLTYTAEIPLSQVTSRDQFILACGKASKFYLDDPVVEGFGLFIVQLPERKIIKELLYLRSDLNSPAILEKEGVVLFVRKPFKKPRFGRQKGELWSINLDGSNLKKVPLPIVE
jgi:hypothetical protein